jgi:hypothetical protein
MSRYDIFAWIVLFIVVASAIGVFCIAGWLPAHIGKTLGHPQAEINEFFCSFRFCDSDKRCLTGRAGCRTWSRFQTQNVPVWGTEP